MKIGEYLKAGRFHLLPLVVVPVVNATAMTYSAGVENHQFGEYERIVCTPILPPRGCVSTQGRYLLVAGLCLIVGVFLLLGVNYANACHIGDRIRRADQQLTELPESAPGERRSWVRACLESRQRPLLITAMVDFAIAIVAGLVCTVVTNNWGFIVVGLMVLSIAAWYVNGVESGYYGLEEFGVFCCFGIIPCVGTSVALNGVYVFNDWFAGCVCGLFALADLLIRNMHTVDSDEAAGRETLAVKLEKTPVKAIIFVAMLFALTQGVLCTESAIYRFSSVQVGEMAGHSSLQVVNLIVGLSLMVFCGVLCMVDAAKERCRRAVYWSLLSEICFAYSACWYESLM